MTLEYVDAIMMVEYALNKCVAVKGRALLEEKMATVFNREMGKLSTDLQKILIDDMVTAFESRLNVLNRVVDGSAF